MGATPHPLPHGEREPIAGMFGRISRRYDLNNDVLSFGCHRLWKRTALKMLDCRPSHRVLDLCCGTGDFLRALPAGIGADFSLPMLIEARKKIPNHLICAQALTLPFKPRSFDRIIIGFGIRNIPNLEQALSEIYRVLNERGRLVILEFSRPRGRIFSRVYSVYLNGMLPAAGGWISGDAEAYRYLARTIGSFPDGLNFLSYLEKAGFRRTRHLPLFAGIATIYAGEKG